MMEVRYDLARIRDAALIAELSRKTIEDGLPWLWTAQRVARQILHRESIVLVARVDSCLVGFAIMHFGRDQAHLNLLAVAPAHRRHGIGCGLVRWLEESANVAGTFTITLEVRAGNARARRFYRNLGYTECGRARDYYSGVEDAIRLTRDLRVMRSANTD
ncbi:MAG: GNAT family N-acetyltransferase [Gammaproteobacteria bacterium]